MDALTCAKQVGEPIGDLGGRYMLDPATFAAAPEVGLEPNIGYYLVGRYGLLGNISTDELNQQATFIEPNTLATCWDEAVEKLSAENDDTEAAIKKVADRFLLCAADWGRTNLSGVEGLEEFCEAAAEVIKAVETADHYPLYDLLRGVDLPDDVEAKTAILAHTLRELRFCRHAKVVEEAGMKPVEAIISGRNGEGGGEGIAKMFQWPEPFPELTDELSASRKAVEVKTDELSANDFSSLSDDQRASLADSIQKIISGVGPR